MSTPNKYRPEGLALFQGSPAKAKADRAKVLKARMARYDRAFKQEPENQHTIKMADKLDSRAKQERIRL